MLEHLPYHLYRLVPQRGFTGLRRYENAVFRRGADRRTIYDVYGPRTAHSPSIRCIAKRRVAELDHLPTRQVLFMVSISFAYNADRPPARRFQSVAAPEPGLS